jgi:calcium/calmodulin-dependent protein kinase I
VKIIDFGLGTFVDVKEYLFKRCGTPGFVAPEVILYGKHQKYDVKADIFSAGVIFYILLKGSSPFPSNDFRKVLKMNKACKIKFDGFDDFSPACLNLLKKMLEKDPKDRFTAL